MAFSAINGAYKLGLRRPVAWALSAIRPGRRFSIDERGHWVNCQRSAVLVSPNINTKPYAAIKSLVLNEYGFAYSLRPGDTVIDIGAGIGEEAVVFGRLVRPGGRVLAIEAFPDTFDCLRRTLELSHVPNVTPIHCAVTDKDGEIGIGAVDNSHLSNSLAAGDVIVPARTIDSLAREHGIDVIDFLYMNIEGAERLAIRGMAETIARTRNVLISCHDFCAHVVGDEYRTREEVKAFLLANGFTLAVGPPRPTQPWVADYIYASRG